MQPYFRFEGKAFRVIPQRNQAGSFGWMDTEIHADRLRQFRFREWDNPDAYFDENIRRMLGNYRYSITELADNYLEKGRQDSAKKWLRWGEENIPFNYTYSNSAINSMVLYAYSYASSNDSTSAVRLADTGSDKLVDNLQEDIDHYDVIQNRIIDLNEEIKQARMNANMDKQQNLRNRVQQVISQRDDAARDINFAISHLTILQRIYYMFDETEKATNLANEVNSITSSRIGLPDSKEENKKQFDQFGFD
jgi:hypothetical protein